MDSLKQNGLDEKYELNAYLKPGWLLDDINGNRGPDIALLVTEKASHKKGILLLIVKAPDYYVFGAGTGFGDGGDDFGMNIGRRSPVSPSSIRRVGMSWVVNR